MGEGLQRAVAAAKATRAPKEPGSTRGRSRPDAFLKRVLAFMPPEARPRVEAVFLLGREIKKVERDSDASNDIGVFLAMCEQVATEWALVARFLNEGEPK